MDKSYRYKIIIEYLGSDFCGWQRQSNGLSVQEVIEASIYKFSNQKIILFAAGRTDAGVHASGQVAHFELNKHYPSMQVQGAINHFIKPHKAAIVDCTLVNHDFHARFSAIARHYLYRIINRPAKIILEENKAWWIKEVLNVDKMQSAANYLLGKQDFTSFRAKDCQAQSPIKTISKIELIKTADEIKIYISAPSFLYHMVRNIVGTLRLVGNGKLKPEDIQTILNAKDRSKAGPTAPAHGLYFLEATYLDY